MTKNLANHGTCPRTYASFGRDALAGSLGGSVAREGIRTYAHVAHHYVEQHGSRHDWDAAYANVEPNALFLEPAYDPAGGVQSPCTPSGKKNGMDLLHKIAWVQQIGFTRAWCSSTYIDTGNRTFFA